MGYLIYGAKLFTDHRKEKAGVIDNGAVYVENDIIQEVGTYRELKQKYPDAEELGGRNEWVMPGFVDGHHHGNGLSYLQAGTGYDFLENALYDWAYSVKLTPELNAKLTAWKHIRSGCTAFQHNNMPPVWDHGFYERSVRSLETYRKLGMRVSYSLGIRDKNFLANDDRGFYETLPDELKQLAYPMVFIDAAEARKEHFETFDKLYAAYNNGLTNIFFAPGWSNGSSPEYLQATKEKADALGGLPIHIHTLQTPIQCAYGLKYYGKSLLAFLNDNGIVDEHFTLGHAVWLTAEDIALLQETNANITHHPSCNFWVRNGIAPVYALHQAGVNVALGLDEKGVNDDDDAISELRMIYMLHRVSGFDLAATPCLDPYYVLSMGTNNSAKVLGLEKKVGVLAPGYQADVITVSTKRMLEDPWTSPEVDPAKVFIHRAKGEDVQSVLIGGKLMMKDRKCLFLDLEELYGEVREKAEKGLSDGERQYADTMAKLKPYMQKWYAGVPESFEKKPYYILNNCGSQE